MSKTELLNRFNSVTNLVKVKVSSFEDIMIKTFTPKTKKFQVDDIIYANHPELVDILPRCCSLVIYKKEPIGYLMGMKKFTGFTPQDDDDLSDLTTKHDTNTLFDVKKVIQWQQQKKLRVFRADKENGKFVAMKIFDIDGRKLLVYGSKNYHIPVWIDEIDTVEIEDHQSIIGKILIDIKKNISNLKKLDFFFTDRYTLCGELCDGQHFVTGDNTICWFGLFKEGVPLALSKFNEISKTVGIKITKQEEIKVDSSTNLDAIFKMSRTYKNEGSVIYFYKNLGEPDEESYLVKTKSVRYIVMRMFRQILMKGYTQMTMITSRFINTKDYHNLSHSASIRITNQLYSFGIWMMKNKMNPDYLGMFKSSSSKMIGFISYWNEYLKETKNDDIEINLDDFGKFNDEKYLNGTSIPYQKLRVADRPRTVFIQGIQGSGKSTFVNHLVSSKKARIIKVEQDEFDGNTKATQGYLYHCLNGLYGKIDFVIISRCNLNETHFKTYQQIAFRSSSITLFISPKITDERYLVLSYLGILERSESETMLKIGNSLLEAPKIYQILLKSLKDLEMPKNTNLITTLDETHVFPGVIPVKNFDEFHSYVVENKEILQTYRIDLKVIIDKIFSILANPKLTLPYKTDITYSGFFLSEKDHLEIRNDFDELVKSKVNLLSGVTYLDHVTEYFRKNVVKDFEIQPFGTTIKICITHLIIRRDDKACAFKVKLFDSSNKEVCVATGRPHLTAFMPCGISPVESNKFVMLDDDTVEIIPFEKTLNGISLYV
ncbi:hypothetical protein crov111 [Cafeteria roenbergensis virus]|uniref:Uncharacterized protein n=1 Tax=Cafeteria roenbergensis virus (strain BV-PW1) TaxID=693272 RepID=E3T4N1_CROVB|nr:hypothetical protein crov111 [Cafeteria roenbergensis virus BV-PW1]ADO67144.1 hypothetical protein crov111 [Cafeteria roenbergensis virus BV-PW1]